MVILKQFSYSLVYTMGGDEEPKSTVELVIREQTNTVADGIKGQVEKMVEAAGVDASSVKPVIDEAATAAASTAATVVEAGIKEVTEALGLKAISESSLSEDQKKLASSIYDTTKASLQSFINDTSLTNTVKITKTLGQLIKQLENAKIDGKSPSGADKKAVAIQLGRILIKEVMPDDKGEKEVLMVYDVTAEPTLEAMLEVSKVVNVAVHEAAQKCCPGLLELFKRAKATK